jgi:hypothetical protein
MGMKPVTTQVSTMSKLVLFKDIPERVILEESEADRMTEREIWLTAYLTALKCPFSAQLGEPEDVRNFAQKCADVAVVRMRPLI